MTSFVHTEYSTEHAAIARAEQVVARVRHAAKTFSGSRATASLLLAAVVATANQMIDTWTDGHLMAAWMVLWAIAFTASALLTAPLRTFVKAVRATAATWQLRHREVAADQALWSLAQTDSRVMADISRAMASALPR
jgi:hypothetical protein